MARSLRSWGSARLHGARTGLGRVKGMTEKASLQRLVVIVGVVACSMAFALTLARGVVALEDIRDELRQTRELIQQERCPR